jgi:hypothetical protein
MPPFAYISHRSENRVRIKVPSKKGDKSFFSAAVDFFASQSGILKVTTNDVTGSILLIHSIQPEKIMKSAEKQRLFTSRSSRTPLSNKVIEVFKGLNKKTTSCTEGYANLPDLTFLSLLGLGLYQISRGNFTAPAWYAAFWYALNIFLKARG